MATFDITAPDGRRFRITGDSPEGAHAALMKHLGTIAPSAQGEGAETAGFGDPLLEALREGVTVPDGRPSPSQPAPTSGPASTPGPGRLIRPAAPILPYLDHDAPPVIDQARPVPPPMPPRESDRLEFGMMGGASPELEAWARREITRQEAGRGNGQNADPLLQAMEAPQPAPTDPFAEEGFGELLKRRGQQFAQGAAGVVAAVPESVELLGRDIVRMRMPTFAAAGDALVAERETLLGIIATEGADSPRGIAASGRLKNVEGEIVRAARLAREDAARLEIPLDQTPGMQAGEAIRRKSEEVVGAPDPRDQSFWAKVAEGGGSAAGFAGAALIGAPLGPAGVIATGASAGAAMNSSQIYREAIDAGASEEDALKAARIGGVIGTTEVIPIGHALKLLPKPLRSKIGGAFFRRFVHIAESAGEEAAQEFLNQFANNIVAQKLYDPERGWMEGTGENALIGALLGGGMGAIGAAVDRTEQAPAASPREPDESRSPAQPPTPPADPLVAAMGGEAAPARPAAPAPPAAPQADTAPAPVEKPAERPVEREAEAEPQYEILDEVETVDGETRPTGRKVRVDLTTGEASVVDADEAAGGAPPAGAPARARAEPEAQPQEEAPSVGAGARPAAGSARAAPRRRFLTHEETLAIETDPQTFQYKGGADTEGVTTALQGVTRFDPNRAGQVVLFETKDGRTIVADGHQRTGLARRMAEAGQQDVGGMAAVVYREADGWTPEEVMALAALKNIGEGSGTAVDAARVLRNRSDSIEDLGLPPKSALVRTAEGLRRLSDQAFGMVVNGRASERDGAIVGRAVANRDAQLGILGLLTKLNPANAFQAEAIARQAAQETTTETQSSLFGDEEVAANLYLERAKILDNAVKRLADEKRLFATLTDRIEAITSAGNVLAKDENARRVDAAGRMRDYLTSQANVKGPISDALSAAARDLKAGKPVGQATGRFLEDLKREIEGTGGRGEAAPGGRSVDQGEDRREEPQRQEVSPPEDDLLAAMGVKPDPATRPEPKPEPAPQDGDDLLAAMGAKPARNPEPDRRAKDEARVRGSQSKIRTGAPQKDAGPLFDTQGDIEKAAARSTGHDLIMRGRAILSPFERDGDEAYDREAGEDLTGSSRGRALADELAGAANLKEKTDIAVRWVTERGKRTGVEHGVILDADGVPLAIMSGHKTGVSFHSAVWRAGAAGKIAVSVHNHPSSSGVSASDLAILALWPKHRMVIAGHNGDRHEFTSAGVFDKAGTMDDARPAEAMTPVREELQLIFDAIRMEVNGRAWEVARERSQSDGGAAAFHKAMRPVFALAMERAGMIRYTDTAGWLRSMQAEGFDFEAIHGQISGTLADRLGRAGFDVAEKGRAGRDRAAGSGTETAPPGTERPDREPAPDGERGDRGGRVRDSDRVAPDDGDAATGFEEPDDRFAAEIMRELVLVDDIFQNPVSTATTVEGVFADIDQTIEYVGDVAQDENSTFAERAEKAGADALHLLRTAERPDGTRHDFFVFENADDVWLDVSELSEGEGGSAIYAAVADYAFNAKKVFIGDPDGLSLKALRRRTEAMLSSALKLGTTRHLAPHPDQVAGHPKQGVPALQWTEGDDLGNVQALIDVSIANLTHHIPELARARYDFRTGAFVSSQGKPLSDEVLDGWASQFERVRKARAGRRTLKRGILLNTLSRATSEERPGLLERALRQPRQLVERGLKGTFYQSEEAKARAFEDELMLDEDGNWKEEPSPLSREEIRALMPKLRAELDRLDLKRVRLFQDNTAADWQGMFLRYPGGGMEIIIGASLDPMKTIHHEVIHILRSMNLFTPQEWRALEIMAARKWVEEFDIVARYPQLMPSEQIEEAIAEAFADAAATRKPPRQSMVVQAFNKIARLFRAIRNVFRGAGFNTVEDVFGRVIAGELTRRNAGNTGAAAAMQEDERWQKGGRALLDAQMVERIKAAVDAGGRPDPAFPLRAMPPVLNALGVRNAPLIVRKSVFTKADKKHGLDLAEVVDAINALQDPVMVFDSDTLKDGLVALVETSRGGTMVVAIHPSDEVGRMEVSSIASVYEKTDARIIPNWMTKGLTRYINKRAADAWFQSRGLQLPREGTAHRRNLKILQHRDVFKGGPGFESPSARFQAARAPKGEGTFSPDAIGKIKVMNAIYGPPQEPKQLPTPPAFSLPHRRFMTRFREEAQDRFIMFEAVNAAIAADIGSAVPEHVDFRLRQTVYDGRTAARLERLLSEEVRPISRAMKEAKVTSDDVGVYLIAKHAKERNAIMAQRDPERFANGNGSGLYDEAAQALLAEFDEKGMTARLEKVSKMVRAMLGRDLDLREKAGLVTKAEADSWRSMYQNYVPLRGAAEREEGGQIGRLGRGFDIRGKEVKTALGRMSVADNPLAQAIAMRQEGIVRAEKNRAMQALLFEVQKFPNRDLWEVLGKLPTRKMLDPDTGMVRNIVDFGALREDEIVGVKIGGESHYIRIKDRLMVEAVKNLHQANIGMWARFVHAASALTRTFSRFQTGANPNFVFPNAEADFLEGVWTSYNADKKKMMRGYIRNYPVALAAALQKEVRDSALGRGLSKLPVKAVRRLFGQDIPADQLAKIEKYVDEWELSGGRISFMAFRDLDEITRDINAEIEAEGFRRWVTKPWTAVGDMVEVIEKVNQPVESAGRLAMYITARENGYSKDKAAAMSLDASGNYYRRGRMTRGFSAFYAFANPAVQGIEKFVRFSKKPRNLAIMAGVVATGYAMTMVNMLLWGDDDDPEGRPLYMQVPEFERSRSLIIPYGIEEDESVEEGKPGRKRLKYFMFRIPHNLRFLLTMGNELAMAQMGHRETGEATSAVTSSFLMNSNPFSADTIWNMAAPTAIDPLVDTTLNRTWTGTPIRPDEERWNEGVPRSSQVFERSTSHTSRWIAQGLNRLGGGDRFTQAPVLPGVFDRYPGEIDYLFNYWTGGLGRFVKGAGEMVLDTAQGIESDPGRTPILRSVVGRTNQYPTQERYYDLRTEMNEMRNRARFIYKQIANKPEDQDAIRAWERISAEMNVSISKSGRFSWKESLAKPFDDADDLLKAKREELLDNQNDDNLSRKEKVENERRIKREMEDIQRETIRVYLAERAKNLAAIGPE